MIVQPSMPGTEKTDSSEPMSDAMRIESGPTKERKVRTLLLAAFCAGMAGWFAYDGWVGYLAKNIQEHRDQLSPEERAKVPHPKIYPTVTKQSVAGAKEATKKIDADAQRKALQALYGGPPSFEDDKAWYYFGPAYRVKVILKNGKPRKIITQAAEKTMGEIRSQKALAIILGVVSLLLLLHLIRVWRTHLVLDDDGLRLGRIGPIRWDQMESLNCDRFQKKGWVDLLYSNNGTERRLRLDEYHLAGFDEVIAALCSRKKFEDPVALEKAQ